MMFYLWIARAQLDRLSCGRSSGARQLQFICDAIRCFRIQPDSESLETLLLFKVAGP